MAPQSRQQWPDAASEDERHHDINRVGRIDFGEHCAPTLGSPGALVRRVVSRTGVRGRPVRLTEPSGCRWATSCSTVPSLLGRCIAAERPTQSGQRAAERGRCRLRLVLSRDGPERRTQLICNEVSDAIGGLGRTQTIDIQEVDVD